jgi:transcriptional regulator with XRE-family HTH domain
MVSDRKRQVVLSAVAHILREERMRQGLSLSALASAAGLSHQMVSFVEKERRNPTLDTLLRIAGALKIDLAEIIRRAMESTIKTRSL